MKRLALLALLALLARGLGAAETPQPAPEPGDRVATPAAEADPLPATAATAPTPPDDAAATAPAPAEDRQATLDALGVGGASRRLQQQNQKRNQLLQELAED